MALSFRYLIGGAEQRVAPGSFLWESPLPMDRHHFQKDGDGVCDRTGFTHGDYFLAARRFFEEAPSVIFAPESCQTPTDVDICLMKHGAYYHPSKITVTGKGQRKSFVLNVAVSDSGHRIIDREIVTLKRLGGLPGPSFIPEVYGQGSVPVNGGLEVRMFLGEWFDGYHEFHLSERHPQGVSVWGERDVPTPLSREAAYLLYHQAAGILTRYYNPVTTEHVSRWHHAAGDFVVRCRNNGVDVRLITVRHYSPLLKMQDAPEGSPAQIEQALAGLLLFLIGLSILMRLDRLEGIGDTGWADETAILGTWSGFLEGLASSCFPAAFLPDPVRQFERHLATYCLEDVRELSNNMAASLPVRAAEKEMIKKCLPSHIEVLLETISRIGFQ